METYLEMVYRFRVMKTLNDPVRNPKRNRSLYASFKSIEAAEVCVKTKNEKDLFGDLYELVDFGKDVEIEREAW